MQCGVGKLWVSSKRNEAVEDVMAGTFEIQRTPDGQFIFNLKARTGEILLISAPYDTKANAQRGATSVMTNALLDHRFERKTSTGGDSYFILKAANGDPIGVSDRYASPAAMEQGIESVQQQAPTARVDDLSVPTS